MKASKNFDPQIIQRALEQGREGVFFDFKFEYHDLRDEKKKGEFCKDAIAMANVARRTGLPAYLIFGIGDMNDKIGDVSVQSPYGNRREEAPFEKWMEDQVRVKFQNLLGEHVCPTIEFDFEYGPFEDGFVSYLQFRPNYSPKPHRLSKPISKNQRNFHETTYVRYGSQNLELKPEDIQLWEKTERLAYFSMKDWKEYIEKYRYGDFEKMSEVGTAMPAQVRVAGQCYDALEYLLEAIQNESGSKRVFVLTGVAGSGKTIVLHRLAYQLAMNMPDEFSNIELGKPNGTPSYSECVALRSLEVFPPQPIPVFVSLRQSIQDENQFHKLICQQIRQDCEGLSLESFFAMPFTRWVLCLDGLDELDVQDRLFKQVLGWLQNFPNNVWIVLTSRPITVFPERFTQLEICPYRVEDVHRYIRSELLEKQIDNQEVDALLEAVGKAPWLDELLCYPRYMRALLDSYLVADQEKLPENDRAQLVPLREDSEPLTITSSTSVETIPLVDVEPWEAAVEEARRVDEAKVDGTMKEDEEQMNPPAEAHILTWLMNYMYEQECKRLIGDRDPEEKIQRARSEIRRLAWNLNWSQTTFSCEEFEEAQKGIKRSIKINQRMNLIVRDQNNNSFFKPLLHWFFAAEYMVKNGQKLNTDRRNRPNSDRVLTLAQQLDSGTANQ